MRIVARTREKNTKAKIKEDSEDPRGALEKDLETYKEASPDLRKALTEVAKDLMERLDDLFGN